MQFSLVGDAMRPSSPCECAAKELSAYPAVRCVAGPRGRELVAARDISAGEELIVEPSVLWGRHDEAYWTRGSDDETVAKLFDMCPWHPGSATAAMPPSNATGAVPRSELAGRALDVNSFRVDLGDGGPPGRALFLVLGLTNHSCDPSASVCQVPSPGGGARGCPSYAMRARRRIAAGGEITIAYVPRSDARAARRESLRKWGFECACARCAATDAVTGRAVDDTIAFRCPVCSPPIPPAILDAALQRMRGVASMGAAPAASGGSGAPPALPPLTLSTLPGRIFAGASRCEDCRAPWSPSSLPLSSSSSSAGAPTEDLWGAAAIRHPLQDAALLSSVPSADGASLHPDALSSIVFHPVLAPDDSRLFAALGAFAATDAGAQAELYAQLATLHALCSLRTPFATASEAGFSCFSLRGEALQELPSSSASAHVEDEGVGAALAAFPAVRCAVGPAGRGLLAARDIAPQETIFVEEAFLWELAPCSTVATAAATASGDATAASAAAVASATVIAVPRSQSERTTTLRLFDMCPWHASSSPAPSPLKVGGGGGGAGADATIAAAVASVVPRAELVSRALDANAFRVETDDGPGRALFLVACLANHSCDPSASVCQVAAGAASCAPVYAMTARRRIRAGEEISIAYVSRSDTRAMRQESLHKWGFECACTRCTAKDATTGLYIDDTIALRCRSCSPAIPPALEAAAVRRMREAAAGLGGGASAAASKDGSGSARALQAFFDASLSGALPGRVFAGSSHCADCCAPRGVALSGALEDLTEAALRRPAHDPALLPALLKIGEHASPRDAALAFLAHPVLVTDDVRMFTALNELLQDVDADVHGELYAQLATLLARTALRTPYISAGDLGIEVEEDAGP